MYLLKRRSSSSNSRSVVLSMFPVFDRTEVVALLRFFLNPDLGDQLKEQSVWLVSEKTSGWVS